MADNPYRAPASDMATDPAESTAVRRGRLLFWFILAVSIARVLGMAISGLVPTSRGPGVGLVLALTVVQLLLLLPFRYLYRGGTRARFVLIAFFVLHAFGVVQSFPEMTLSLGGALMVASGIFAAWATYILALSPSLEAFVSAQRIRAAS